MNFHTDESLIFIGTILMLIIVSQLADGYQPAG